MLAARCEALRHVAVKIEADGINGFASRQPAEFLPGMKFELRLAHSEGSPFDRAAKLRRQNVPQNSIAAHADRREERREQTRFIERREHCAHIRIPGRM
jgi:hypothetical protein